MEEVFNGGWVSELNDGNSRAIIDLVNSSVNDEGTLGYARPMASLEAQQFLFNLGLRLAAGESHVFLGRMNDDPAILAILSVSGMPNCRHRAEISKGVVAPRFRGRHLVERVFREIVGRCELLRVEQLVLDVREGTRAHKLWQHFGFRSYGVLEDYARFNGKVYRGHFMVQSTVSLRERVFSRN